MVILAGALDHSRAVEAMRAEIDSNIVFEVSEQRI